MKQKHGPCPFEWGDRIDHKLFGLGTIVGEPVATFGASAQSHEIVPRGWRVSIEWDDPDRKAGEFGSSALKLVSRPDAKGGAYWNNEFKKLLDAVKKTRTASDNAMSQAFRPKENDGLKLVDSRLLDERAAVTSLREFLLDDEQGEHR